MSEAAGVLWSLQIVLGPIILGLALAYGALQWRRRGLRQGESRSSVRDIGVIAVPVVLAIIVAVTLMMIPGGR